MDRRGEIYVDDVLITDVLALPAHKVQAYNVASEVMLTLARDYAAPNYVKVQVPGKAYPELWGIQQFRFYARIGDIITETYVSGEIVNNRARTGRTGEDLAIMIRRGFQRATAEAHRT